MTDLNYCIQKNIDNLQELIKYTENELSALPDGRFSWGKRSNGSFCFYNKVNNKRLYISSENHNLAEQLAKKEYLLRLKKAAEDELSSVKFFQKKYHPEIKFNIYSDLHESYKCFVKPAIKDAEMKISDWNSNEHVPFLDHPEALKFLTKAGDYVRSKSEMLIANTLYEYSSKLSYIYEPTIEIKTSNGTNLLHPDFGIINLRNGERFYWEHAGLIEFEDYMNGFVWKQRQYESIGIIPGRNLIITMETRRHPLDYKTVVNQINNILDS